MPVLIGITGTIATGKSLIGNILKDRGYTVIDTDEIVHNLLSSNLAIKSAVAGRFGREILDDRESIDRAKLAAIVFADDQSRKDLETIIHPATISALRDIVSGLKSQKLVFLLVPLLFEAGLEKHYDEIWVVATDEPILRQRLKERNGYNDADIDRRLSAQWPQADKIRGADKVIDNSSTIDNTTRQVVELLRHYPAP